MKQEHDYSGALEDMPDSNDGNYPNDREYYACLANWAKENEAIIRAALTAQRWMPIESAPIGEHVRVFCPERGIVIASCQKERTGFIYPEGYDRQKWRSTWRQEPRNSCFAFKPTHWKPLDKPPQDGGDDAL